MSRETLAQAYEPPVIRDRAYAADAGPGRHHGVDRVQHVVGERDVAPRRPAA